MMSIYQYSATGIDGSERNLSEFEGKVLLIVNTASNCGFTRQFGELQLLYQKYEKEGFSILGFPCNQFRNQEPGSAEEIQTFCQKNYGVTFPLFSKVNVKGERIHPVFEYLTGHGKGFLTNEVKWNFTKFLIGRNGEVVKRYAPTKDPLKIEKDIKNLLN